MNRLPEIGDHVWRVEVDGKTVAFDGFVIGTPSAGVTVVVPRNQPLATTDSMGCPASAGSLRIDTLLLVRHLHGWRWVPREFRPEVRPGDVLVETVPHGGMVDSLGELLVGRETAYGWGCTSVAHGWRVVVAHADAARAIAGIDGWRWIPAGWPGEPRGAAP